MQRSQLHRSVYRLAGRIPLAASQQLIPHGLKCCLASANVGPAVLICALPDFIDLAKKLRIGTARGYGLGMGTAHNVIGTEHISPVGAEGFEEDRPMLRWGGGQDVPSYKAAAKQQHVNHDVSLYNG